MLRTLASLVILATAALGQNFYSAVLDSAQEVPSNASTATGWGIVRNPVGTDLVEVFLYYEGQTGAANAAHVHLGLPGTNGAVVMALNSVGPNTFTGSANIGLGLIVALEGGGMYLNLHTGGFPGGEIRGQIVKSTSTRFTSEMSGAQEVPPAPSGGSASVVAFLHEPSDRLVYSIQTTGTAPITAGHLHLGAAGSNGPVMRVLNGNGGVFCGVTDRLNASERAALMAGNIYCNIHTTAFPGGELRGQLNPMGAGDNLSASADGLQEVPPSPSPGIASATATRLGDGKVLVQGEFSGFIGTATAAHVHQAPAGANGPVILAMTITGNTFSGSFTPTAPQLAALQAGDCYINIHSTALGAGEVRGQLLPSNLPTVFGGGCDGSNGVAPQIGATGTATLGTPMSIDLYGSIPTTFAVFAFGASRESFGGIFPLPLGLSTVGINAPGCYLLVDPAFTAAQLVDPRGCASVPINMPLTPALVGSSHYSQWFVLDPAANGAGLVASNGLGFTIE